MMIKKRLAGVALALILILGFSVNAYAPLGDDVTLRYTSTAYECIDCDCIDDGYMDNELHP